MAEFTASNGVTVNTSDARDSLYCVDAKGDTCATAAVDGTQALREFFEHEKDEQYGRWRWPEHPAFVVYPIPGDLHRLRVLYEPNGIAHALSPDSATSETHGAHRAARAYWAAHRDQPWYHARPGEVWELTFKDGLTRAAFTVNPEHRFTHPALGGFDLTDPAFVDGRLVWAPKGGEAA